MTTLNIRIHGEMTPEKVKAIEIINKDRVPHDYLELDEEKWKIKLEKVFEDFSVKFNFSVTESGEILLLEEGYIEPVADPMYVYNSEMQTFNAIKTTYELCLISDEEFTEAEEYMRSLYPSEFRTFSQKKQKPEWFDRFKTIL